MGRKTMVTRCPKVSVRLCQREYHGSNRDESITLVACIIVAILWPPERHLVTALQVFSRTMLNFMQYVSVATPSSG